MTMRRMLGAVAATAALVLVPTTASAYNGEDEALVVTDSNVEPGEPFTVVVDAGAGSDEATLTVTSEDPDVSDDAIEIAGSQSLTKATNAAGVAEFTVTLFVEGAYTLVGTDEAGNVVGESTVVVGDGEAGEEAAEESGVLPSTGAGSNMTLLGGGGALLLAAGTALLITRRRKAHVAA